MYTIINTTKNGTIYYNIDMGDVFCMCCNSGHYWTESVGKEGVAKKQVQLTMPWLLCQSKQSGKMKGLTSGQLCTSSCLDYLCSTLLYIVHTCYTITHAVGITVHYYVQQGPLFDSIMPSVLLYTTMFSKVLFLTQSSAHQEVKV